MDISTSIFIVICIIIFVVASLIKHKHNMEKLETEERIYRLKHRIPPREDEDRDV